MFLSSFQSLQGLFNSRYWRVYVYDTELYTKFNSQNI